MKRTVSTNDHNLFTWMERAVSAVQPGSNTVAVVAVTLLCSVPSAHSLGCLEAQLISTDKNIIQPH